MSGLTFTIEALPEDTPVRGNAQVSGDAASDRETEDELIARLDAGDIWAWCTVKVTGRVGNVECSQYLGCCSYEDEKGFREGGYFEDMCKEIETELRSVGGKL